MAHENGLSAQPGVVAEIGPGDSLGMGLAALFSGADKYFAFDIVKHINKERNVKVLDELVGLFSNREDIPDVFESYKIKPYLKSHSFPGHILTDECLERSLSQERIDSIRDALLNLDKVSDVKTQIRCFAPWYDSDILEEESVDMIISHAVLEHVDDIELTLEEVCRWLKPGGFVSFYINLSSHSMSVKWNGHWACSDFVWKLVRGKRPYLLNRQPCSRYIDVLQKLGFEIVCDVKYKDNSGVGRLHLAPKFENISDEDLATRGTFIQAIKKR